MEDLDGSQRGLPRVLDLWHGPHYCPVDLHTLAEAPQLWYRRSRRIELLLQRVSPINIIAYQTLRYIRSHCRATSGRMSANRMLANGSLSPGLAKPKEASTGCTQWPHPNQSPDSLPVPSLLAPVYLAQISRMAMVPHLLTSELALSLSSSLHTRTLEQVHTHTHTPASSSRFRAPRAGIPQLS